MAIRYLSLKHLGHEADACEMLTQAVMKVLPDSPLLPPANLEDFPLQALSKGDIPHYTQYLLLAAHGDPDLEIGPALERKVLFKELGLPRRECPLHVHHALVEYPLRQICFSSDRT